MEVKKEISHKDYQEVLQDNQPKTRSVTSIRSFNHQIFTDQQTKLALTSFYDKMVMNDGINCNPYGYLKE